MNDHTVTYDLAHELLDRLMENSSEDDWIVLDWIQNQLFRLEGLED